MEKLTFVRFERKYLVNTEEKNKILEMGLKYLCKDKYMHDDKTYSIYNIYFDTYDNNIIRTSISKPPYKEKLRLRTYEMPVKDNTKVFFEIKKKYNGMVNKRRITTTYKDIKNYLTIHKKPQFKEYLSNQVLKEIDYYLNVNNVKPNYYISYERAAYFGKDDPSLRITFDRNITYRTNRLNLSTGDFGKHILPDDTWIMEVKFEDAMPIWLVHILTSLDIYKTSYSKYGKAYQKEITDYISKIEENGRKGIIYNV